MVYPGHALVENQNGLIAAVMATQADGYAEREAALLEAKQTDRPWSITVGADKAYDSQDSLDGERCCVEDMFSLGQIKWHLTCFSCLGQVIFDLSS